MRILEIQAAPMPIHMNVGNEVIENEKIYTQIRQQICAKRKFLLEQQQKMNRINKENEFIQKIRDDYFKYNDYIKNQRQQQINAFNNLNEYLNKLTQTGNLSKNNIRDAKAEQKKIIQQINLIKQNLEEIIKE